MAVRVFNSKFFPSEAKQAFECAQSFSLTESAAVARLACFESAILPPPYEGWPTLRRPHDRPGAEPDSLLSLI